jgi:hypothetical protein
MFQSLNKRDESIARRIRTEDFLIVVELCTILLLSRSRWPLRTKLAFKNSISVPGYLKAMTNCYGALTGHDYDRMHGPTDA